MRGGNQGRLREKMTFELGPKINTDIAQMEKDGSLLQENLTESQRYGVFKEPE